MADFKAHLKLEVIKDDRTYEFFMPIGAPLGECYDACFVMLQKINDAANKAVEDSKRKEEDKQDEVKAEESKEEAK